MAIRVIKHGSGYRARQGFNRTAETGYTLLENLNGCQAVWPNYFRDQFNYTLNLSQGGGTGSFSSAGNIWQFENITNGGHGGTVTTPNGSIYILSNSFSGGPSSCQFLFYPLCPTIPSPVTAMSVQLNWKPTGNFNPIHTFADALPCGSGGPAAFLALTGGGTGLNGYFLDLTNKFSNSLTPSHFVELDLVYWNGIAPNVLANYQYQGEFVTPDGHGGWTAVPHLLKIVATKSGLNNILNCFLDGVNVITFTDTRVGIPQGGNLGFQGGSTVDTNGIQVIQDSLLSGLYMTAP